MLPGVDRRDDGSSHGRTCTDQGNGNARVHNVDSPVPRRTRAVPPPANGEGCAGVGNREHPNIENRRTASNGVMTGIVFLMRLAIRREETRSCIRFSVAVRADGRAAARQPERFPRRPTATTARPGRNERAVRSGCRPGSQSPSALCAPGLRHKRMCRAVWSVGCRVRGAGQAVLAPSDTTGKA